MPNDQASLLRFYADRKLLTDLRDKLARTTNAQARSDLLGAIVQVHDRLDQLCDDLGYFPALAG